MGLREGFGDLEHMPRHSPSAARRTFAVHLQRAQVYSSCELSARTSMVCAESLWSAAVGYAGSNSIKT